MSVDPSQRARCFTVADQIFVDVQILSNTVCKHEILWSLRDNVWSCLIAKNFPFEQIFTNKEKRLGVRLNVQVRVPDRVTACCVFWEARSPNRWRVLDSRSSGLVSSSGQSHWERLLPLTMPLLPRVWMGTGKLLRQCVNILGVTFDVKKTAILLVFKFCRNELSAT